MLGSLRYSIFYFLYWLLLFQVGRLIFLIVNLDESMSYSAGIQTLWHGLPLDLSASAYLCLVPFLLLAVLPVFGRNPQQLIHYYSLSILTIVSLIIGIDARLFSYWGFRIDATPLFYLETPSVALNTLTFYDYLVPLILAAALFLIGYRVIGWIEKLGWNNKSRKVALLQLLLLLSLIIPIRGGIGIVPLNVSKVYFSSHTFLNQAAINPLWNLVFSLTKSSRLLPIKHQLTEVEANRIIEPILKSPPYESPSTQKYNVVLLILEGFTSRLMDQTYGGRKIVPNLEEIRDQGLYFSSFYASGDRTDKGLVAILSGYPSQPANSIMKYPVKARNLPSLLRNFKKQGYQTQFAYGGDLEFANMKAYVQSSAPDQWLTARDFVGVPRARWGVPDHILLDSLYDKLIGLRNPFFSCALTLSSHEPFDVPRIPSYPLDSREAQFINSASYTDQAVGRFIRKLKSSALWENTLVVIVADHGHRLPGNSAADSPEKFSIPMIWTGGAVDSLGVGNIDLVGSQTDIPSTLLSFLNISDAEFGFSRNLLSTPTSFAWYAYNDGYGVVTESGLHRAKMHDPQSAPGQPDSLHIVGRAFYEYLMYDFEQR